MGCRTLSGCPGSRKGERMMGTPSPPGILEPRMLQQTLAALGSSWPACPCGAGGVPRKGSVWPC